MISSAGTGTSVFSTQMEKGSVRVRLAVPYYQYTSTRTRIIFRIPVPDGTRYSTVVLVTLTLPLRVHIAVELAGYKSPTSYLVDYQ